MEDPSFDDFKGVITWCSSWSPVITKAIPHFAHTHFPVLATAKKPSKSISFFPEYYVCLLASPQRLRKYPVLCQQLWVMYEYLSMCGQICLKPASSHPAHRALRSFQVVSVNKAKHDKIIFHFNSLISCFTFVGVSWTGTFVIIHYSGWERMHKVLGVIWHLHSLMSY